jgi:hypothetical protein
LCGAVLVFTQTIEVCFKCMLLLENEDIANLKELTVAQSDQQCCLFWHKRIEIYLKYVLLLANEDIANLDHLTVVRNNHQCWFLQ